MKPYVTISPKNANGATLTYISSQFDANVSNPSRILIPNNTNTVKGFQLSSSNVKLSTLNSTRTFFGPRGFSGYLSTNSQQGTILLTATGGTISTLYIVFDKATGEYAKTIKVNDTTIANDKVEKLISFPEASAVTLTFTNWSAANATPKVTSITILPTLTLTGTDLLNFKCSENLLDSDLQINPGICEQYADIEIYDRGNVFHDLAQEGFLDDDVDVSINTDNYALGIYIASDWDIEIDNSVVGITCRDRSYLFEKILIQRADIAQRTIDDLLNILFSQANIAWNYLDNETQTRCQSITIPNNWFAASDLKTLLDKICSLGMLRMYWSLNTFYVGRAV